MAFDFGHDLDLELENALSQYLYPEQFSEQPQQVMEQPQQVVEQPQQVVEQPQQVVEQPQQVVEQPSAEQLSMDQSIFEEPFLEELFLEQPSIEQPSIEQPSAPVTPPTQIIPALSVDSDNESLEELRATVARLEAHEERLELIAKRDRLNARIEALTQAQTLTPTPSPPKAPKKTTPKKAGKKTLSPRTIASTQRPLTEQELAAARFIANQVGPIQAMRSFGVSPENPQMSQYMPIPPKMVTQSLANKVTKSSAKKNTPRARPIKTLMVSKFGTMTQEEKERVLLPLFEGKNPVTGEKLSPRPEDPVNADPVNAYFDFDSYGATRQNEALQRHMN